MLLDASARRRLDRSKSEWAAIWRIVDGGGFDPGLQPDADLRGDRKKSPLAAGFVSM